MNETLDGVIGMERLTDLEEHVESILQRRMPMVDSRTIGLIASKRHFEPVKEQRLIDKSRNTRCKCRHNTQTTPCLYRSCLHMPENHFGVALV